MRTKRAAENNDLVLTGGHLLEAVDFILPLGIAHVQHPRLPVKRRDCEDKEMKTKSYLGS